MFINKSKMIKTFILILAVSAISYSLQLNHEFKEKHDALTTLDLTALRQNELDKHNAYRSLHGVPPLVINATLNTIAQDYANTLFNAHSGLTHSAPAKAGQYGENLYWAWGYPSYTYPKAAASISWYSEIKDYNFTTGQPITAGKVVGHFTAMVWKGVTSVGFGYVQGSESNGFAIDVVANYYPTPNYAGQYTTNVLKPV